MSRKLLSLSAAATLIGSTALADAPRVAVDIAPVHSLVARVMAGVGTPDLIIPANASPHQYNLRPSEAAALQEADLVFWIGPDLTPWLEDAVETLSADATVTTLLDAPDTVLHDFRENALFEAHDHGDHEDHDDHGHDDHDHDHGDDHAGHDDHDHDHDHDHSEAKAEGHDHEHDHDHGEDHAGHDHDHDHDHGQSEAKAEGHDHDHDHGADHASHDHDHDHDHGHSEAKAEGHDHDHDHGEDHAGHDDHHDHHHGEHDPHAWLSPQNASVWLNVIAAQLSAQDPDNAGAYFANAADARAEMEALSAEVSGVLDPVRGGSFVVFHDAYQYFEVDFDFPAAGAISLSDARDPSPARVAEIQARVRNEGVDCVLAEPQYNPGLVATVLDGTEAATAVIDPLGSTLEAGPDLYPQLIRNLATTLADCL